MKHYIIKRKEESYNHSTQCNFQQDPASIHNFKTNSQQDSCLWNFPQNIVMVVYNKHIGSINLSGEKLKTFPLRLD